MAPPETGQPLVFASAVEGFRSGLGDRLDPALLKELKDLGLDLRRPMPAYPLDVWEAAMRRSAAVLFQGDDEAERHRRLGKAFIDGYVNTALGAAALTIGRLIGPARMMSRMSRNFRVVTNYIGSEAVPKSERQVELRTWMMEPYLAHWVNRPTLFVDYRHGVLEAVLEAIKVKGQVDVVERDYTRQVAAYRICWT
jgi:uncharacterized protein (TIGR02265 family)